MDNFEPYLTFRLVMAIVFTGLILYDLIGMAVWYRGLPRLAQRIVLLKLLQVRSRTIRFELFLIILLMSVEGGLMILFLKGD